jgi:hypothetical protein
MAAQQSELFARLVDLFGSPATADPTKLYGNLTVSPNGNVLIGTQTDNGESKLQVSGLSTFSVRPKFNGATPWDNANSNPDRTLLQTLDLSNVGALVFSDLTGYESFEVVMHRVNSVVDGNSLVMEFSSNNGASWIADTYGWGYTYQNLADGTLNTNFAGVSPGAPFIQLFTGVPNGLGRFYAGTIFLPSLSYPLLKTSRWTIFGHASGGEGRVYTAQGVGVYNGAAIRMNAMRLRCNGGNISGKVSIYGINS